MKTRYKKRGTTIFKVKEGASHAAYNFLSAFSIFIGILMLTTFFIFFQWKNVKIRIYLEQIDKLQQELLIINAENSQIQTVRNELLKNIPEIAKNKLDLVNQVEPIKRIYLNRKNLIRYEEK
jgi:hypothetical protein